MNKILISRILLLSSIVFLSATTVILCISTYSLSRAPSGTDNPVINELLEKTDDEWREYLNSSIDNAGELAASDAEAGYTEGLSIFDDTLHNLKDTDANNRIAETEFAKARYMADNNHSRQALEELLIPMSEDDSIDVSIRYRVNLYAGVIYQRLGDTQKAEEYGSKADVLGDFGIGDDSLEENE